MPTTELQAGPPPTVSALDTGTTIELSRHGLFDRIAFALVYAGISLCVLPWIAVAGWAAAILVWELAITPPLERAMMKMPEPRAADAYAVFNLVGAAIYQGVALLCLVNGSAVGVAIAATWIGGSILNVFVFASSNRQMLLATLFPTAVVAVVGPFLAYGLSWRAAVIPVLLALAGLASRRFSLDHGVLLRQLADRQVAFADIERKLSIAVEASGDGLFELDIIRDQIEPGANWLAMLGYGPDEIETPIRNWRRLVHPDDVGPLEQNYAAHVRGQTSLASSEIRMRCKDGTFKWVLSRARLISRTLAGAPERVMGTTIDLTTRKALELQLEAARDVAESANEAKSVFVANMSHEIRTPLNGVIGVAGALARTGLSGDQREMVGLIQSSGQMLDRMLSDILDQAKIEAGDFALQTAPFDLRHEIDSAAELMRARADEKGLGFHLVYSDRATGIFDGDAVRLRQIVSNLAANAIKFTASGEVRLEVDEVDPPAAGEPALIRVTVTDTGIGFDADTAERLFSRFVQADGSISRRFGGTGLGLSICKALADLMGGRITAHSKAGAGSVFMVELPMPRPVSLAEYRQRHVDVDAADPGSVESARPLGDLRILLAEDHPTNQRVVQLILGPMGVDLTIVGNGREAVDICQVEAFDLILMDMQMPVMDGLAATREIRQHERRVGGRTTPIAMFSANAMEEHLAQAMAAGANHHIAKPITPERLLSGIERTLSWGDADPAARGSAG